MTNLNKVLRNIKISIGSLKFFILPLLLGLLFFSGCQKTPFRDSLEGENYETIRLSTYFEGKDEILTREEFEGYKSHIINAINGSDPIAAVEKNVLGNRITVKPFILKISDLSPDVKVMIDGKEQENKSGDNMEIILLPGSHTLSYRLATTYYKEDKDREINTSQFNNGVLEDTTGWKFRDFKVSTEDEGSFLVINGSSYMKLSKGLNTVKNLPSVPLEIYSEAENDHNYRSEVIKTDGSVNSAILKLGRIAEEKTPLNTNQSKTIVITAPKNNKPGLTTAKQPEIEGLESGTYGIPTNISVLKLEKNAQDKYFNDVKGAAENLQKSLTEDITKDDYNLTSSFIQKGSNLEFWIKKKIAEENSEKDKVYTLRFMEIHGIIFEDNEKGFVDFTGTFEVSRNEVKIPDKKERFIYYFQKGSDGTILFTRYEKPVL